MRLLLLILAGTFLCIQAEEEALRKIPNDVLLGAATAAYQIEGGWNEDGKGENIWDHLTHYSSYIVKDHSTGDIADDSYHQYKRDVEMMRELNLDAYRFSFSWSRILPTGFANKVNKAGVAFYNNYIDEMLKYNITPMATLYHWDLPQPLQELGGWTNPHIVDWFADYAKIVFESFGDRVKLWITMNEPREVCYEGYESLTKAPIINSSGIGNYLCAKYLVLAHAKAYHLYDDEFRKEQNGKCGITISTNNMVPATPADEEATELYRQSEFGLYANPIFNGDWPKDLKKRVAEKSKSQGFPRSRLPDFTQEELDFVKGSYDFYGMNHYTTIYVYKNESTKDILPIPSLSNDLEVKTFHIGEQSVSSWLYFDPKSLISALKYVHSTYGQPAIYVTENGWSTRQGLNDEFRSAYYRAQLNGLLDALDEGINVKGYMAWSLMDNFEWIEGYTERFGLYEVDYQSENRTRTPRQSAFVYKEILRSRVIDESYDPEVPMGMWIEEGH